MSMKDYSVLMRIIFQQKRQLTKYYKMTGFKTWTSSSTVETGHNFCSLMPLRKTQNHVKAGKYIYWEHKSER